MHRFVIFAFLCLIAMVAAQNQGWNNNNQQYPQYPNQQNNQFPQFPQQPNINDICNQPGANCKIDSRFAEESSQTDGNGRTTKVTRVCDNRGCYDRKVSVAASAGAASVSHVMVISCAVLVAAKMLLH